MATEAPRSAEELQHALSIERQQLVAAVETLRASTRRAAGWRTRIPLAALGVALGTTFVLRRPLQAIAQTLSRRRRDAHVTLRLGRYAVVRD